MKLLFIINKVYISNCELKLKDFKLSMPQQQYVKKI